MSVACIGTPVTMDRATLDAFRAADSEHLAKREIDVARMRSLDGSKCAARSNDGVALGSDGSCVDLGDSYAVAPAQDGSHGHTPLRFLPAASSLSAAADSEAMRHATAFRAAVEALQFPAYGCGGGTGEQRAIFYMHELPQVGFGSVIEYAMMFIARGLAIGAPLRIGRESSRAWTSPWFCGQTRAITCYFNLTGCCGVVHAPGATRPLVLPRRRDPINVGARGYNEYGSAWLSAHLARFLFDHATPRTRAALAQRRASMPLASRWLRAPPGGASVGARGRDDLVIGLHIRRGDSCHKGRYCPANLTTSYFAAAATLRAAYGANRILLATDDAEAARLCEQRALGFECTTQRIERRKFESAELIENRVAQHAEGSLSGSAVALDALADIDMLADCDMFVLLLRSCFARVAYALAMGRRGRPPPVISLEAPWSPYKGAKSKKGMMRMMGRDAAGLPGQPFGRLKGGRGSGWHGMRMMARPRQGPP